MTSRDILRVLLWAAIGYGAGWQLAYAYHAHGRAQVTIILVITLISALWIGGKKR